MKTRNIILGAILILVLVCGIGIAIGIGASNIGLIGKLDPPQKAVALQDLESHQLLPLEAGLNPRLLLGHTLVSSRLLNDRPGLLLHELGALDLPGRALEHRSLGA